MSRYIWACACNLSAIVSLPLLLFLLPKHEKIAQLMTVITAYVSMISISAIGPAPEKPLTAIPLFLALFAHPILVFYIFCITNDSKEFRLNQWVRHHPRLSVLIILDYYLISEALIEQEFIRWCIRFGKEAPTWLITSWR